MTYLNKYSCSDCSTSSWAVGDPLQCSRCGGTMLMTQQGTTPLPAGAMYRYDGGTIEFDWDNFNEWWGSNA